MDYKTIALKLGLPETATESEVLAKVGALQLSAGKAAELEKELGAVREAAIAGEVDAAIKLRKITAAKREHFVLLGKAAGVEQLRATLECMAPAVKPTDVIVPGAAAAVAGGGYKKLSEVPEAERVELRKSDMGTYKALFKAEYGFEMPQ